MNITRNLRGFGFRESIVREEFRIEIESTL